MATRDGIEDGGGGVRLVGIGAPGDTLIRECLIGKRASHDSATPLVIGGIELSADEHVLGNTILSAIFRAVAACGNTPLTGHVRLINTTDSEVVATANFNSTSTATVDIPLVIGTGVGQLKPTPKTYEVHIWVDAPALPIDTIELYSAGVRLINTVS